MNLCLTKKVQDLFQMNSLPVVNEIDSSVWHANIEIVNRKKILILCHSKTGYTVFIYGFKKSMLNDFNTLILNSIKETMAFDGFLQEAIKSFVDDMKDLRLAKTANKSIIAKTTSSKKTMLCFLEYLDSSKLNQKILSHRVNSMLGVNYLEPHSLMRDYLSNFVSNPVSYKGFELDVSLKLEKGFVIRRLLIPNYYTLDNLHIVIQKAFGFNNSHLYDFLENETELLYGIPDYFDDLSFNYLDSRKISLEEAFENFKEYQYNYDFGDSWNFHIICRMIHHSPQEIIPTCLYHEGENIPDDVGGVYGYEHFINVYNNPNHQEYNLARIWSEQVIFHNFNLEYLNHSLKLQLPLEFHYSYYKDL